MKQTNNNNKSLWGKECFIGDGKERKKKMFPSRSLNTITRTTLLYGAPRPSRTLTGSSKIGAPGTVLRLAIKGLEGWGGEDKRQLGN